MVWTLCTRRRSSCRSTASSSTCSAASSKAAFAASCIDALGDLASAATDPQRLHDYLYALVQHFAVSKITSILNFETPGNSIVRASACRMP